jgi:dTDP-L-rhamnose 4-epimerase
MTSAPESSPLPTDDVAGPAGAEDRGAEDRGAAIDIVLPCLDEVAALPWVLARLPAGARAIVVDNGSSDGSAELARSLGATVVDCERRGYGAACHAGLEAADADVVAFCDCDASIDPGLITALAEPVFAGTADLVVGRPGSRGASRAPAGIGHPRPAQRLPARDGAARRDGRVANHPGRCCIYPAFG